MRARRREVENKVSVQALYEAGDEWGLFSVEFDGVLLSRGAVVAHYTPEEQKLARELNSRLSEENRR